jgi:hypothetical protein
MKIIKSSIVGIAYYKRKRPFPESFEAIFNSRYDIPRPKELTKAIVHRIIQRWNFICITDAQASVMTGSRLFGVEVMIFLDLYTEFFNATYCILLIRGF